MDKKDVFITLSEDDFQVHKAIFFKFKSRIMSALSDDNLEHSIWLNFMHTRFKLLHKLLSNEGVIFVNLDDSEAAYCKALMDEIFGRSNYLNEIIVSTNESFGFKSTSDMIFKQANHILFYAKNRSEFEIDKASLLIEREYDTQYKWVFFNTEAEESDWYWENINTVVARENGFESSKAAKKELHDSFDIMVANYAIENAERVFRTASVSGGALLKRKETIAISKGLKNKIVWYPDDDMDYMFIGGERVIYYRERLSELDGQLLPAKLVIDIWLDISVEGLASEGGVSFPKGKKPEKLLRRCIEMSTKPGDIVLDSFLGEDIIIVTRGINAVFNRVLKLPQSHKMTNWCVA
ncbi:MAG: site-specific DNA-methyltransferase [Erysipelotrichaceae bacterium]|nr:site-specific DNA-methyltransferase [Erysipelotrichaceae bacterium]